MKKLLLIPVLLAAFASTTSVAPEADAAPVQATAPENALAGPIMRFERWKWSKIRNALGRGKKTNNCGC